MNSAIIQDLYQKYGFLIHGRCVRILRSDDEADDAVQAVFLQLIRHIDQIRDQNLVVPWIYRTATNYCFNILRDRKKFVVDPQWEDFPSGTTSTDSFTNNQIISLVMGHHGGKVRDAVYYTYVEELTQEEIHEITGQSPATVRRNLSKFRKSLPGIKKRLGI